MEGGIVVRWVEAPGVAAALSSVCRAGEKYDSDAGCFRK